MHRSGPVIGAVSATAAIVAGLVLFVPSTAQAATSTDPAFIGLFGKQDPTYDGVYRQSLAIIALDAANADVPTPSVNWLLRQQCGNGRFPSFRSDVSGPCGSAELGDADSTSLATIALTRVGRNQAAQASLDWLIKQQTRSGGWEFSAGFGPNTNTTGLVIQALIARNVDPDTVKTRHTGAQFLSKLQLDCSSDAVDDRGALDFQTETPLVANDYATAQATQALAGSSLPVEPAAGSGELPAYTCPGNTGATPAGAASGYLGRTLDANGGLIPSSFGGGSDYGSTVNAVLSLVASHHGSSQVASAMTALESHANDFLRDASNHPLPASAAALILAEHATQGSPRNVDGINVVHLLLKTRTLAS
jgi:hypothetical protein